jgi:3'-phosphoadenosine 5'-phosphosulfate sulfotransferase (PAPS reductase)/FAD synthetase
MNEIIENLIADGALFVINHSGGKDSQAMMIEVLKHVPASQCLVVHATLGRFEWHGALELAQKQAADAGVPFVVAQGVTKDGSEKDFASMVRDRKAKRPDAPSFPSSACRQCTSDLKRGPIEREIRHYIQAENDRRDHVMPIDIIVNCVGIRAAESDDRAKLIACEQRKAKHDGLARAGRTAWNWLPIFDLTTEQVFQTIANADQTPHWAYAAGNERLSCVFCIMGSKDDIINGAKHRPELFAELAALEVEVGYTLHMSRKTLTQLVTEAAL